MLSIIVAKAKNNVIGKNNQLIWHLPEDLNRFKKLTTGHTIIMGRKTFESLPKMLPNRHHIVISSSNNFPNEVEVFKDLKSLNEKYGDSLEELFVIGGGSIYKAFIDIADKLYLTEVEASDIDADTYFPKFDKSKYESTVLKENEDNEIKYRHVLYKRS